MDHPTMATADQNAHLQYSPKSSVKNQVNYQYFLDCLGFNVHDSNNRRREFILLLRKNVDLSANEFHRLRNDEKVLKELGAKFLKTCGDKFWGPEHRQHLAEKDSRKGFLYPRDADRENSTLVRVLEELINYRAMVQADSSISASKGRKQALRLTQRPNTRDKRRRNDSTVAPQQSQVTQALGDIGEEGDGRLANDKGGTSDSGSDDKSTSSGSDDPLISHRRRRVSAGVSTAQETAAFNAHAASFPQYTRSSIRTFPRRAPNIPPPIQYPSNAIELDSDSGNDRPRKRPRSHRYSSTQPTLHDFHPAKTENIKEDHRWIFARAKTILLVKSTDKPDRAEINVPLATCTTIHDLFVKIPGSCFPNNEQAQKADFISARFLLSSKRLGIRRNSPDDYDWERFMKALVGAVEAKEAKGLEEYEVEMTYHVDKE